ncbi:hypothetical protein [Streptomyces sp. RB17]|uniref:hypothetical protein n=1 Tax=Streptomyces sp. RB17 TaxID=2585197 RepID=UPI001296D40D|nr:hypothetical protein [Streptomyces sp. RB17]
MSPSRAFGGIGGGVVAAAVSAVLLTAATGCSAGRANTAVPAAAPAGRAPVVLSSVDLKLPIERYLFSASEKQSLVKAVRILVQQCMDRYDVPYRPAPIGPSLGVRSLMDRRYGITDERAARADGYHLGDRDPRTHPGPPPARPTGTSLLVLTGRTGPAASSATTAPASPPPVVNGQRVPAGGCAAQAEAAIAGSGRLGPSDLAQDLNDRSFLTTKADARVTGVFRAWSRCMKGKGFSYPDPLNAMSDRRFQGAQPTHQEIQVASADVDCKRQTNLVGMWFAVETAFEKAQIRQNAPELTAVLKAKQSQLRAAAAVLATD